MFTTILQMIKINAPAMGNIKINIMCFPMLCTEKDIHHFYDIPNKNAHPESNHKVTSDKPNTDVPPNILHILFKNVNIKKEKAKPRNRCHLGVSFTINNIHGNKIYRLENNIGLMLIS